MGNHKAGVLAALRGARPAHRRSRARLRREPSSALWLSQWVPARGEHAVDRALAVARRPGRDRTASAVFGAEKICRRRGAPSDGAPRNRLRRHPPRRRLGQQALSARALGQRSAAALARATGRRVPGARPVPARSGSRPRSSSRAAARAERAEAPDLPRLVALLARRRAWCSAATPARCTWRTPSACRRLFLHGPTDPAHATGPTALPSALRSATRPPARCDEGSLRRIASRRGSPSPRVDRLAESLIVERAREPSPTGRSETADRFDPLPAAL